MAGLLDRPRRIAVVGGGAGGLELAIRLARATRLGRRARVTLVDRNPAHIWKPRLHEIAAGLLVAAEEEAGYAAQAAKHGFDFVLGEAAALDPDKRELRIAATPFPQDDEVSQGRPGEMLPARTLAYDIAVLAIGSTVDDFGTPGVGEHAYALDTPRQAQHLHRAFLAQAARVKAGVQPKVRVVIVGAGTTGVELAAELRNAGKRLSQYRSLIDPDQLEITVIEMGDRPLPSAAESLSAYARDMLGAHHVQMHFGAKVTRVEAEAVQLKDGRTIAADLIVWASGVKSQELTKPLTGFARMAGGQLTVDATLRAMREDGEALDSLYAIGDCAAFAMGEDGKPLGATAQAAHQQAHLLARSIARQLRGRPALPFRFHYQGTLVSLGAGEAVGDVPAPIRGGLRVAGGAAKLAYAGLYQAHLAELFGWGRTAALTLSGVLRRSAQPSVKLYW